MPPDDPGQCCRDLMSYGQGAVYSIKFDRSPSYEVWVLWHIDCCVSPQLWLGACQQGGKNGIVLKPRSRIRHSVEWKISIETLEGSINWEHALNAPAWSENISGSRKISIKMQGSLVSAYITHCRGYTAPSPKMFITASIRRLLSRCWCRCK